MATTISKLAVILTANTAAYQSGLKTAGAQTGVFQQKVGAMGLVLKGAAIGAVAGLVLSLQRLPSALSQAIAKTAELIDHQGKMARQLGITQAALAGLSLAAKLSGVQQTTLEKALQKLTRNIAEASHGLGEAEAVLKLMNLDAKELAALAPDEQLLKIASALGKVGRQGDRIFFASKLFGERGVELIRLLEDGGKLLKQSREETERWGTALSEVEVQGVERMNDAITRLQERTKGLMTQLTADVAPVLEALIKQLGEAIDTANLLIRSMLAARALPGLGGLSDFNDLLRTINKLPTFTRGAGSGSGSPPGSPIDNLIETISNNVAELLRGQRQEAASLSALAEGSLRGAINTPIQRVGP
jgi:hypothetical protein